jgi:hypothetical protein
MIINLAYKQPLTRPLVFLLNMTVSAETMSLLYCVLVLLCRTHDLQTQACADSSHRA